MSSLKDYSLAREIISRSSDSTLNYLVVDILKEISNRGNDPQEAVELANRILTSSESNTKE